MMPSGIGIINVQSVNEHEPPLQTQIVSAEYEITYGIHYRLGVEAEDE